VRELVAAQFPQWADEPLRRVPSSGTVNAIHRLGADKVVRIPFRPEWAHPAQEAAVLTTLASALGDRMPRLRGLGEPSDPYPHSWLVLDWIDGERVDAATLGDAPRFAADILTLLADLRAVPVRADAPVGYRGGALAPLDDAVRAALAAASDLVDVAALRDIWADALSAGEWRGEPVWIHCDLLPGNILIDSTGRLRAVIDWEAAGVGDPACELMIGWAVLSAEGRRMLRATVDDDTWRRGRGWALAQAAIALPYYRDTNADMVANSLRIIRELLRRTR
jgi:aminoglycoside phosphotransferase (APT) family kinase protein